MKDAVDRRQRNVVRKWMLYLNFHTAVIVGRGVQLHVQDPPSSDFMSKWIARLVLRARAGRRRRHAPSSVNTFAERKDAIGGGVAAGNGRSKPAITELKLQEAPSPSEMTLSSLKHKTGHISSFFLSAMTKFHCIARLCAFRLDQGKWSAA